MMEFFFFSFWVLSLLFWNSHNPISLCLILILTSSLTGISCWLLSSKWIGLSIILVFVGGMMVSFLYVSSLAFNQKITLIPSWNLLFFIALIILPKWNFHWLTLTPFTPTFTFNSSMSPLVLFLIFYLLLALFFVVKITESFKGSLTQKF
uniref:NADH dehydrogenase subunit 6 n=1 Tax=Amphiascoides atopus TaxID=1352461 RepID=W8DNC6_9MAXI|nr:NADH dehydrogenase subunit 6 [Amphiascoides atopus]AHB52764.1 NADH dehydrogenase subunit 6 [Amphiascoides atopus]